MCGRYVFEFSTEDFASVFRVAAPLDLTAPRWNVAPTQEILVIANVPGDGPRAGMMRWGFLPANAAADKRPPLLINARAETVQQRPTFRESFARGRRCLIPATGWYEWQRREDGKKQPMRIRRADGKPIAFAGLWSLWRPPGVPLYDPAADPPIRSAVIITAAPAPSIAAIHDRMPLALPESRWDEWLTRKEPPLPAAWLMQAREEVAAENPFVVTPVSTRINNVRNDDAECVNSA